MENKKVPSKSGDNIEGTEAQSMPLNILAQYVRDLSFENPHAPHSLQPGKEAPDISINIGMDARKLPDNDPLLGGRYEVVLSVSAEARRAKTESKDAVMFIAEIQYGILVEVGSDVPEDQHHPLLLIEIPRIAFPYVRQILSDLTQQGGYSALMLTPVDFYSLYMQRFGGEKGTSGLNGNDHSKENAGHS